jgi:hypothetical protein
VTVDGGSPILLNGSIALCARSDLDAARFFSGRLAALSIYDVALNSIQVANLYGLGINGNASVASGPVGTGNRAPSPSASPEHLSALSSCDAMRLGWCSACRW